MRLIARCKDMVCNIKVDSIERIEDVVFAYRKPEGCVESTEFVGCFDLGVLDYLYVTEERL